MSAHDAATSVRLELYEVYEAPENRTCKNRRVYGVRDFSECAAFENYVGSNMLVAKFLGNTSIRRREYHGGLCVYKGDTLRNL